MIAPETCACGATGDDRAPIHVGWCKSCGEETCIKCGHYDDPELGHSCVRCAGYNGENERES